MLHLKQCLGVDLGFHSVKIVELALEKNGVRTVRAAQMPTGATPGMSSQEVSQSIVSAAKELIKKGRFRSKRAIFAISGQKVFVRRFRLPKSSEERMARMIQYEARQQIPFPLDKTILQYQHREIPEEAEVEVLLVAVRSDEVRQFMQLVNKVGLKPMAVSVSSFALFNAHEFIDMDEDAARKRVAEISGKAGGAKSGGKKKKSPLSLSFGKKKKKGEDEASAESGEEAPEEEPFAIEEVKGFINLGATSYDLAIGRSSQGQGSVGFIRTVPTGGNEMTKAVQRACNVESFHDAERIKSSSTQLMSFALDMEEDENINQDASMAVTEVADKIVSEIRRSLDFYITQPDGMAIDSLVISGGQALLPGMSDYLEEKLTVPVTVTQEIPEGAPIRWSDSAGPITPYLIPMGLALQGMGVGSIQVDFLPEDRKITRDFPYRVAAVMVALAAGVAAISTQAGDQYADKYATEANRLQGLMQQRSSQVKAFDEAQELHNEVADKYLGLDKSFGQRSFWMNFVQRVAEVKPPGVLLMDIRMDHAGEVTIDAQSDVQVDAAEFNEALALAFEERLDGEPSIESVTEGTRPAGGGQPPSQFTIQMTFKDKVNHLEITPTPTATPTENRGFQGQGMFNQPGANQPRRGQQGQRRGAQPGPLI